MRSLVLLLALVICCAVYAADNPFVGTWKLIKGEYVNHEGVLIDYHSLNMQSTKVITPTHFSFVSKSGEAFWAAGVGTYSYSASAYTEQLELASFEYEDNGAYPFTYKIEGELWHNERFKAGKRVEYELWQKVPSR